MKIKVALSTSKKIYFLQFKIESAYQTISNLSVHKNMYNHELQNHGDLTFQQTMYFFAKIATYQEIITNHHEQIDNLFKVLDKLAGN